MRVLGLNHEIHRKIIQKSSSSESLSSDALNLLGSIALLFLMVLGGGGGHGAGGPVFKVKKYIQKYLNIFIFRTTFLRCLKFRMEHRPLIHYHICSDDRLRVQNCPTQGVLGL